MSKAKGAKTSSKNNPTSREAAKKHYRDGVEIKPVKLISGRSSFFAAEFEGTGELVTGSEGTILPWIKARNSSGKIS